MTTRGAWPEVCYGGVHLRPLRATPESIVKVVGKQPVCGFLCSDGQRSEVQPPVDSLRRLPTAVTPPNVGPRRLKVKFCMVGLSSKRCCSAQSSSTHSKLFLMERAQARFNNGLSRSQTVFRRFLPLYKQERRQSQFEGPCGGDKRARAR